VHRTHGGTHSSEWYTWKDIKQRCRNKTDNDYAAYGGRGIRVCDRWADDFAAFLADMGPRPPGRSIDRINNDGDYEPGNCRWATLAEQNRNRRSTRSVTIDGTTLCAKDWAARLGIRYDVFLRRVRKGLSGPALVAPDSGKTRRRPTSQPPTVPAAGGDHEGGK
jgi:hypothetical protein